MKCRIGDPWSMYFDTYLDDVCITRHCVIEADEEAGTVLRYAMDEKGKFIRDPERLRTELVTGLVELRLQKGAPQEAIEYVARIREQELTQS
jgi:hypothetical protein